MATFDELRRRHQADVAVLLPKMMERIEWSADQLVGHRQTELRRLVRVAKDLSPWHRKRLSDVDPDEVDLDNLADLPTMTKDDVMAHFDEITTDDRLRLEVVEDHLEHLTQGGAYLFDRYRALASGGSSGRRGVFVCDWDTLATIYMSTVRYEARRSALDPSSSPERQRAAAVVAGHPAHSSSVVLSTFETGETEWHHIPVTLPTGEIVDRLNAADPSLVLGYPSALYSLVHEAREGRLSIRPRRIMSVAEPLFPEIRSALEGMWDVPVVNGWGMTEAAFNVGCGQSPGIHLSEDLFIIEPVDTTGRPVPVGTRSDKIFVTNLVNHAMPLIRYEVTDQLTLTAADCPCGSVHQLIEDPLGRLDDCFHYDGITVNAHVFRSPLGRCRHIMEYQVRQTPDGAAVAARSVGPVDIPGLEAEIAGQLSGLGVPSPKVVVTPVDHLERQYSGKLKRFVPL